ncbi:unnamed protein product, partial [Durusdinium trenchii]
VPSTFLLGDGLLILDERLEKLLLIPKPNETKRDAAAREGELYDESVAELKSYLRRNPRRRPAPAAIEDQDAVLEFMPSETEPDEDDSGHGEILDKLEDFRPLRLPRNKNVDLVEHYIGSKGVSRIKGSAKLKVWEGLGEAEIATF